MLTRTHRSYPNKLGGRNSPDRVGSPRGIACRSRGRADSGALELRGHPISELPRLPTLTGSPKHASKKIPLTLSPDLKRVRDEEYNLDIRKGYLLVSDVPHANSKRSN